MHSVLTADNDTELKAYMCAGAKEQQICSGNCESCAWYIGFDETLDGRESTKGE